MILKHSQGYNFLDTINLPNFYLPITHRNHKVANENLLPLIIQPNHSYPCTLIYAILSSITSSHITLGSTKLSQTFIQQLLNS